MAYDKYQDRKARNLPANRERSPSAEILQYEANNEILEKVGISPPSYNDVVVNRTMVPEPYFDIAEKDVKREHQEGEEDLSDAESFYDVVDGMRYPNAEPAAAQASFVEKWKGRQGARRQA